MLPEDILVDNISHEGSECGAEVYGLLRGGKPRKSVKKRVDMSHDHVLLIRHLGLREEGTQWHTTVLVESVIGGPESGAFGREGIDRPIVLVPYSFLAVVESIKESRIIHMKLIGADTNDRACSKCVSNDDEASEGQLLLTVLFMQFCYLKGVLAALVKIVVPFVQSRHGREFGAGKSGQGVEIQPVQRECYIVEYNASENALPRY